MKHTSTIIYFGDNPIGYDLIEEGDLFLFKPSMLNEDRHCFPEIEAKMFKENILISIDDENIKDQVSKLIRIVSQLNLEGKLSAAS